MSEAKKVEFDRVSMLVTPRFEQTGSVGAGDASSRFVDVDTKLELESEADEAVVAAIVDQAERMCFMMDVIRNAHEVTASVSLNGADLETGD
ncbi:MAG: hypothetical protein AAGC67_00620 [Myxococcota bacterium]